MQVSSAHKPSVSSRLHDSYAFAVDFEKFIVSLTALFANPIMICSTSAAHVPLVLPCLHTYVVLAYLRYAAYFEQVIVPVFLVLLALFVNWTFIYSMSIALAHWDYLNV